jgi:HSP20 family protein
MRIGDLVPWRESRQSRMPVRRASDPFETMQRELDRVFEEFSSLSPFSLRATDTFSPAINVNERSDRIEVTAELPGLTEEDIDIQLTRDVLTVKGEKKEEVEEEEGNYYRRERRYGSFVRNIPLPSETVDVDQVKATFSNGVLVVTLPKLEPEQEVSKRIKVKAG